MRRHHPRMHKISGKAAPLGQPMPMELPKPKAYLVDRAYANPPPARGAGTLVPQYRGKELA